MSVQRETGACPTGKIRYHNRTRCRAAIDTLRNPADYRTDDRNA